MTLGRVNSEISSSGKCDWLSNSFVSSNKAVLCLKTSRLSPLLKFACVNILEIPVYVSDTVESARLNFFWFYKIFRSSEMDYASG